MDRFNLILDTDSYKASHYLQYPPKTTRLVAYLESRGGLYDRTVFFGLQYILKKYMTRRVGTKDVKEAAAFFKDHGLPFNDEGWMYIAKNLRGRIPLDIFAVSEGSIIPTGNILMRVESTDPKCFWATTWFETMLLRVWYPTTVATQSWFLRRLIFDYLVKTSDNPDDEIPFKLHDFGARGVSSAESASIGGAAHLLNFSGSDTVLGVVCANEYYKSKMAAFSIPAAEHSTIIVWGKDREEDAYRNMLKTFAKPGKLVAVVSDSYNLWHAIDEIWGKKLRDAVIKSGATVIIRPDSGDPVITVVKVLQKLEKAFGSTLNKKGYKILNYIRIIQGDGINPQSIAKILERCTKHNYSITNIAFGMGGALLQQLHRDTQHFAYKVCEATVNGKRIAVGKTPATDPRKHSKSGYLDLIKVNEEYKTIIGKRNSGQSQLKRVYSNGELLIEYDLETVRNNANQL